MILNEKQKKRIADILTDTGKIIFATSVIAPLFHQLKINPIVSYAPPPPWWIQCEKAWNSTEIKK